MFFFTFSNIFCFKGVHAFSLSSSPPSSENGHISVCPTTTVTLTCTASGVRSLAWRDQNRQIGGFHARVSERNIEVDPYNLTLVALDNDDGDDLANFTSTLDVMVDDITNGTNISCTIFMNQKYLVIYRIG